MDRGTHLSPPQLRGPFVSTWTWNDLLDRVGGVTQRRRHSALIRLAGFVLEVESDDFALVQDVANWFAAYDQPSPITPPFDRRIRVVLCLHEVERERLPDPAALNSTPAGAPSHPLSPLEPGVEVFAAAGTERAPVYLVFHHPSATVLLITTSR